MNLVILLLCGVVLTGALYRWNQKLYLEHREEISAPEKLAEEPASMARQWKRTVAKLVLAEAVIWFLGWNIVLAHNLAWQIFFTLYTVILLIMCTTDLQQRIIFDELQVMLGALGLIYIQYFQLPALEHAFVGLATGVVFFILSILTKGGIGGGDVKLLAVLGLWLGQDAIIQVAMWGIILGGIVALGALIFTKKGRKGFIPYGPPFIICGILAFLFI